jgi:LmbE family N-acetylglucosaminyl deacetylase
MADNIDVKWQTSQKILVILAHPDDPEFFMGATIARWTQQGHKVVYYLLTKGDKGTQDRNLAPEELMRIREEEQRAAARIVGVSEVHFLFNMDGFLTSSLELRRDVTRIIRKEKPDILVSSDPMNFFPNNDASINHPDHRAAGLIVIESFFPAAGNPSFFPELIAEGYEPHSVKEVWFSLTHQPNVIFDVTETWPVKMQALHQHLSQIGDIPKFDERMLTRRAPDSSEDNPRYEERFRRIIYVR